MMKKLFLVSLSKAMNAYLGLDSASQHRLKKLQGKVITIELLPFPFTFQCVFEEHGIRLYADALLEAETKIRGTPIQMLTLMMTPDHRHRFFAQDLMIEGNAEFGQEVVQLFDELHIDWEEQLSHLVGDVPAYYTSRFIRDAQEWCCEIEESFSKNISEFVHEEAEWLPEREALEDFFSDIDTLRMDLDRIEARINNLQQSLTENEGKA